MKGPKQTREKASKCRAPVSDLRNKSLKVISVKTSVLYIQQKQKLSKKRTVVRCFSKNFV